MCAARRVYPREKRPAHAEVAPPSPARGPASRPSAPNDGRLQAALSAAGRRRRHNRPGCAGLRPALCPLPRVGQDRASAYLHCPGHKSDPTRRLVGRAPTRANTAIAVHGGVESDRTTSDGLWIRRTSEFANRILKVEGDARAADYDGMAELWFDDVADLLAARRSPEWHASSEDARNFIDHSRVAYFVAEEHA